MAHSISLRNSHSGNHSSPHLTGLREAQRLVLDSTPCHLRIPTPRGRLCFQGPASHRGSCPGRTQPARGLGSTSFIPGVAATAVRHSRASSRPQATFSQRGCPGGTSWNHPHTRAMVPRLHQFEQPGPVSSELSPPWADALYSFILNSRTRPLDPFPSCH